MFTFASLKISSKITRLYIYPFFPTYPIDTCNKSNSQCCQEERKWAFLAESRWKYDLTRQLFQVSLYQYVLKKSLKVPRLFYAMLTLEMYPKESRLCSRILPHECL